jgi:hypothetical protein
LSSGIPQYKTPRMVRLPCGWVDMLKIRRNKKRGTPEAPQVVQIPRKSIARDDLVLSSVRHTGEKRKTRRMPLHRVLYIPLTHCVRLTRKP